MGQMFACRVWMHGAFTIFLIHCVSGSVLWCVYCASSYHDDVLGNTQGNSIGIGIGKEKAVLCNP